jgi:protein-tyrosine phosphatase
LEAQSYLLVQGIVAGVVEFRSLLNFRDVGGRAALDGAKVRRGRLYRSDTLTNLSPEEIPAFDALGVATVVDLRRPHEIAAWGRIADIPGRRWANIAPDHPEWDAYRYDESTGASRFLADRYLNIADLGRVGLGDAIRAVIDDGDRPTTVHCFAGKDRTGVVVAVTLALAGVDDEEIADDYALSDHWQHRVTGVAVPTHWAAAPREAILLFLADLRAGYGSVAGYAEAAGLWAADVAVLRERLLV